VVLSNGTLLSNKSGSIKQRIQILHCLQKGDRIVSIAICVYLTHWHCVIGRCNQSAMPGDSQISPQPTWHTQLHELVS